MKKFDVGINFDVIGLGHAGSKVAQEFGKLGYKTFALNTAPQDLEKITGPKLAISTEGAGKDRAVAKDLFSRNKTRVMTTISDMFSMREHALLICGLGGGTGSGILVEIAEALRNLGYEYVSALVILPKNDEGALASKNTLNAFKEIWKACIVDNTITSIMLADNNKMYKHFPNTSITEFWTKANTEIVKPLHNFNAMCTNSTEYTAIDPKDFRKIVRTPGCITFGRSELGFYDPANVSDAMTAHFETGLMAEGFSLFSSSAAGVIIMGDDKELSKIPKEAEGVITRMFKQFTNGGKLFSGIYAYESYPLTVYSIIAGMDAPYDKVKDLQKEVKKQDNIEEHKKFDYDENKFDF